MTRVLTRLNPYWTLVGAIAYTIAIGLVFGYVSASEATGALVVYLGAAVLMTPPIAITLIGRRSGRRRERAVRTQVVKLREAAAAFDWERHPPEASGVEAAVHDNTIWRLIDVMRKRIIDLEETMSVTGTAMEETRRTEGEEGSTPDARGWFGRRPGR